MKFIVTLFCFKKALIDRLALVGAVLPLLSFEHFDAIFVAENVVRITLSPARLAFGYALAFAQPNFFTTLIEASPIAIDVTSSTFLSAGLAL